MNLPKAPLGAVSAAILVALDSIWGTAELGATASIVGSVGVPFLAASVFVLCGTTVTFLQRYVEGDGWGASIAKGLACGILAGVPFPVMGTGAGAVLLGWAGINRLGGGKSEPPKMIEGSSRDQENKG